jgi:hypothetical protein
MAAKGKKGECCSNSTRTDKRCFHVSLLIIVMTEVLTAILFLCIRSCFFMFIQLVERCHIKGEIANELGLISAHTRAGLDDENRY